MEEAFFWRVTASSASVPSSFSITYLQNVHKTPPEQNYPKLQNVFRYDVFGNMSSVSQSFIGYI